jgi:hypothetical protein
MEAGKSRNHQEIRRPSKTGTDVIHEGHVSAHLYLRMSYE